MYFSLFIFLCCFPFCFPRCASLLWSPLYYPVALPRCWVEVLEPTVAKTDDLGLAPIFKKNISKICDFRFFSDLCTGIILKQLNKIKNLNIFFSLFIFLCCFSCFFFPVVLPYCGPCCLTALFTPLRRHRDCRGDRELLAFIFHQHARARWRKTLTPTRCIGITARGRHHAEIQRGDTTGKPAKRANKTGNKIEKLYP